MNSILTVLALSASVVLEVVLELKGVKVPDIVLLLSGFAVRHIIGTQDENTSINGQAKTPGIPVNSEVKP